MTVTHESFCLSANAQVLHTNPTENDTMDPTPYPITITRQQLADLGACKDGLAAFDAAAPDGTLVISSAAEHVALLSSPLAPYEGWAIGEGVLQPITATAGIEGTATAGDYGTATAGYRGTAAAGDRGTLRLVWWDSSAERRRTAVAYVGEDGIEPDVPYRLDTTTTPPRFVRADAGGR